MFSLFKRGDSGPPNSHLHNKVLYMQRGVCLCDQNPLFTSLTWCLHPGLTGGSSQVSKGQLLHLTFRDTGCFPSRSSREGPAASPAAPSPRPPPTRWHFFTLRSMMGHPEAIKVTGYIVPVTTLQLRAC